MSLSRVLVKALATLLLLAERDQAKAIEQQKQFKKQANARHGMIQGEIARLKDERAQLEAKLAAKELELEADLKAAHADRVFGDATIGKRAEAARKLVEKLS